MLTLTVDELIAELQEVSKLGLGHVPVITYDQQNDTQFEKKCVALWDFDETKCRLSLELDTTRDWDKTQAQIYDEDRIVIPLYDTFEMRVPVYNDYLKCVHNAPIEIAVTDDDLAVIIRNLVQAGTQVNDETIINEIESHWELPNLYRMHVTGTLSAEYSQIQNEFWKRQNYRDIS